jgi:acetylornithine aminotransferase
VYLDVLLSKFKEKYTFIEETRGKGLLKGIVVGNKAPQIVQKAIENQLLILTAGPNVVRLLPPLTASKEEMNEFTIALEKIFQGIEKGE